MAKPQKYNYLKQMTGQSMADTKRSPGTEVNNKRRGNNQAVLLTRHQQRLMRQYFTEELLLYNNFLTPMQALLKGMPGFYTELNERHKELFAKMSRIGFDIRSIFNRKSKNIELPEILEQYRDILFGIVNGEESGISEQLAVFLEICRHKANILFDTRECMAREFFKFYANQTKLSGGIKTLEALNSMQKRHVQIRKSFVEATWLPQKGLTVIKIPYLKTPIIMNSDINDLHSWNMIIIHKDPTELDLGETDLPWEIEFKQTDETYLLKYIETSNPISKMESRFIKR